MELGLLLSTCASQLSQMVLSPVLVRLRAAAGCITRCIAGKDHHSGTQYLEATGKCPSRTCFPKVDSTFSVWWSKL